MQGGSILAKHESGHEIEDEHDLQKRVSDRSSSSQVGAINVRLSAVLTRLARRSYAAGARGLMSCIFMS